jgi:hypothetical protein
MKNKSIYLLGLLLVICNTLKAQQNIIHVDTIKYVKRTEKFYLNNQRLHTDAMKPLLNSFSSSAFEFKKYRSLATPGTIILLTGLTAGVVAFTKMKKGTPFLTPYSITLFAGDLIGIPLMIFAKKHLRKSATLYNMEVLKQ